MFKTRFASIILQGCVDTLLGLWIGRLASKFYSSDWYVLHLGVRFKFGNAWKRTAGLTLYVVLKGRLLMTYCLYHRITEANNLPLTQKLDWKVTLLVQKSHDILPLWKQTTHLLPTRWTEMSPLQRRLWYSRIGTCCWTSFTAWIIQYITVAPKHHSVHWKNWNIKLIIAKEVVFLLRFSVKSDE